MTRLRMVRSQVLTANQQVDAVFNSPALYRLAALVPTRQLVGRPAVHPAWALLAYGVLSRVFRSGARVENELAQPDCWQRILTVVDGVRAQYPELDIPPAGARAPGWDAWKHARNHYFTDPEILELLQDAFTEMAVEQARGLGLLDPQGPGSLCHPDRSRVVYGDGTVIRPLYRPPAAKRHTDAKTGEVTVTYLDPEGRPIAKPTRRYDPDAADYHGHTGSVHGQNYVALYVRGDAPHQRVVLAVDRVPRPGQEADTAVAALERLHQVAGSGIQAVVYDGAMRGVHIDRLMTGCGVLVINKVHASAQTAQRKGKDTPPRWYALGTWEHDGTAGACTHQLAALDGAVHEIGLTDDGSPIALSRLERKQVKRPRRTTGRYHFNIAYQVPCPAGDFTAWITPHGEPGDADHRRADAVRVIAEGEDDFTRLYGVRNDAESFNSQLKRSLLVGRAATLGGRRQLLDVLCFGLLNNAVTAHHQAVDQPVRSHLRRVAQRPGRTARTALHVAS
ncbi:MAG: hypothetical protein WCD35_05355 [Mycobacteriales bacterium]